MKTYIKILIILAVLTSCKDKSLSGVVSKIGPITHFKYVTPEIASSIAITDDGKEVERIQLPRTSKEIEFIAMHTESRNYIEFIFKSGDWESKKIKLELPKHIGDFSDEGGNPMHMTHKEHMLYSYIFMTKDLEGKETDKQIRIYTRYKGKS